MEKSIFRVIYIEGRNIYENIPRIFAYSANDKLHERSGDYGIIS